MRARMAANSSVMTTGRELEAPRFGGGSDGLASSLSPSLARPRLSTRAPASSRPQTSQGVWDSVRLMESPPYTKDGRAGKYFLVPTLRVGTHVFDALRRGGAPARPQHAS